MKAAGFGTIEAIVAAALLVVMAAAVTSTLVLARRLQTSVAAERYATQLAAAGLERLRAGATPESERTIRGFTIAESLEPWDAIPQLLRAHVRVTWESEQPRALDLSTLVLR